MPLTLYDLIPRDDRPGNDLLLGQFLEYTESKRFQLYPAQEAAILELFEEKNVILNTPTGSGKSLVAAALHFKALVQGKRSIYTCPIKALVNEKWLALCHEFGPDNVGLSTGDASVNRDAPILCCTAEILANIALREGRQANVQEVTMDEFHYYADRERGVAWQVPLLTLPQARLLVERSFPHPNAEISYVLIVLQYHTRRNYQAYKSHRKRRMKELGKWKSLKTSL